MEKGLSYPDQAVLTNANEHDRGQLEVFVDDKECMYVFDRGYLDYGRFDQMTEDGYFFVTRLRKNAVVRVLESFSLPEDSPVFSDEMVVIVHHKIVLKTCFAYSNCMIQKEMSFIY